MKGEIYFAAMANGAVKIGFTTDIAKRMANLWYQVPGGVQVLASFPGTLEGEHWLHQQFADIRISGEWFKPDGKLLAFIERAAAIGSAVIPEETRPCDAVVKPGRVQDEEVQERVRFFLMKLAEPIRAQDKVKDRIVRAASVSGLTESRAFEIWYGRALVTAAEYVLLKEMFDVKVASQLALAVARERASAG